MGSQPSELIQQTENSLKAGSPAGVLPCCIGAEDGKAYILLGLQPVYPLSDSGVGGWNPLFGWGDSTDTDMQHTAAREAFEESLGYKEAISSNILCNRQYCFHTRDSS